MILDSNPDNLQGLAYDSRLILSKTPPPCPLSSCIKFHSDSAGLSGNDPRDANGEINWFGVKPGDSVHNVGSEDLVILDNIPDIRELISAENTDTGTALNKLFENGMSKVHTLSGSSGSTTENAAPGSSQKEVPLLSVETLTLKPFHAALDSEIYTIHPDHLA